MTLIQAKTSLSLTIEHPEDEELKLRCQRPRDFAIAPQS